MPIAILKFVRAPSKNFRLPRISFFRTTKVVNRWQNDAFLQYFVFYARNRMCHVEIFLASTNLLNRIVQLFASTLAPCFNLKHFFALRETEFNHMISNTKYCTVMALLYWSVKTRASVLWCSLCSLASPVRTGLWRPVRVIRLKTATSIAVLHFWAA